MGRPVLRERDRERFSSVEGVTEVYIRYNWLEFSKVLCSAGHRVAFNRGAFRRMRNIFPDIFKIALSSVCAVFGIVIYIIYESIMEITMYGKSSGYGFECCYGHIILILLTNSQKRLISFYQRIVILTRVY